MVTWEDISQSGVEWQSVDEALEWADNEENLVYQVGFQLDRTEDHILLTESKFKNSDIVGSVTKIPMSVVKLPIVEIPY